MLINFVRRLSLLLSKRTVRHGAVVIGGAVVEVDSHGGTFAKAGTIQYLDGLAEAFGTVFFFAPAVQKSQPQYVGHLSDRVIFFPISPPTTHGINTLPLRFLEIREIVKAARRADVALEFFPFAGGLVASILLRFATVRYGVYFGTDPYQPMRAVPKLADRWRQLTKRLATWVTTALADFVLVRDHKQFKTLEKRLSRRVQLSAPISALSVPSTIRVDRCMGEQVTLLYVGVFSQRKGVTALFEALKLLATNSTRSYRLLLVGAPEMLGTDRCTVRELQEQCRSLEIQHLVDFYGYVDNMDVLSSVYEQADIFVFASTREGFPRVIEEALQHGVPVVAFELASLEHVLQSGVHVMFTKPGDVSAFARCIEEVVSDSDLRHGIVTAGQLLMKARFPLSVVAQHVALMNSMHSTTRPNKG